jgi:hypothetical protein
MRLLCQLRTPERVLESQLQLKEWELQTLKVSVSYFFDGFKHERSANEYK